MYNNMLLERLTMDGTWLKQSRRVHVMRASSFLPTSSPTWQNPYTGEYQTYSSIMITLYTNSATYYRVVGTAILPGYS